MRRAARAGLLATAVLLGACATAPRPAPELAGRLAVRVQAHQAAPARSLSAQFELRGDAVAGELHLSTPIGSTLAQARWRPGLAELTSADGRRSYPTLDDLAQDLLGESLPLAALIEWLRARPWPGAPSTTFASGFEQLGWQIDLSRFAEGWVLAERSAAPAVSVRARLERPE